MGGRRQSGVADLRGFGGGGTHGRSPRSGRSVTMRAPSGSSQIAALP